MYLYDHIGGIRETREGSPLLTVESDVNGGSKSTNEMVHPWLVRWACRASTRDFCSALAALKYFFLAIQYFNSFVPISQQAGQAVVLGCLSLSMCLWEAS
jgi:hypothetical protein